MSDTWETMPLWAHKEIPLTDRQVQVLECFAMGLTTKGAARRLGISTSALKNHLSVIFDKLGIQRRCRIGALIQAWRRGEIVLFATKREEQDEK